MPKNPTRVIPVRPDERVPVDVTFVIPFDDAIGSYQRSIYDVSDAAKTNLASSKVAATGKTGNKVRIVLNSLSIGVVYHLQAEAELLSGNTLTERLIVICQKESDTVSPLQIYARQPYFISFEDKLPEGVDIASATFTGFKQSDLSTDIGASLVANSQATERMLRVDVENGEKDTDYLLHALALTETDPVTDSTYLAVKTICFTCKER